MLLGGLRPGEKYTTTLLVSLLLSILPINAAESMPVRVIEVQSALRLKVEAMVGGLPTSISIQLAAIRIIGPHEHALNKLKELCPPGCEVILQVSDHRLEVDAFGLAKAWVLRDFASPIDPASPPPPSGSGNPHRTSLQVELMRAGWAILDEPQAGRVPPPQAIQARTALEEARTRLMGAYSLPGFQYPTSSSDPREERSAVNPMPDQLPIPTEPEPVPARDANGF